METISVVIPIYNAAQYLKQCMESVVNQTYKKLEIICVDGGSTDGSLEILEEYQAKDCRVTIVRNQRDSVSQARKDGLNHATGKYVSHIDSDDWLDVMMYEKMIKVAEQYDVDAVVCNYYDVKGSIKYPAISLEEELLDNSTENKMIYRKMYDIKKGDKILSWTFWVYLFRREAIAPYQIRLKQKLTCCEDLACIWPFLAQANRIYVLNERLYYYRTRMKTVENRLNPVYLADVLNAYTTVSQSISENEHEEYLKDILKHAFFDITISEVQRYFMKEIGQFYMFPYEVVPKRSRIVLYGAGFMGKSYYKQIKANQYCEIVLWVDKEYQGISDEIYRVSSPEEIDNYEYDYILIAARHIKTAESIKAYLVKDKGIGDEKIILKMPRQLSAYV